MVRPTNENRLHLHVEIYKSSDMLESEIGTAGIRADSETSSSLFKVFNGSAKEGEPAWVPVTSEGISPDVAKYPVAFDVKTAIVNTNLPDFKWNPTEVKWIRYWWYWNEFDENDPPQIIAVHPSDMFSMPFPSSTEVGANAGEAATVQDVLDLQSEVMPPYKAIEEDAKEDAYICYSGAYNILSGDFDTSFEGVILKDYTESKKYNIKMHFADSASLSSTTFLQQLSVYTDLAGNF